MSGFLSLEIEHYKVIESPEWCYRNRYVQYSQKGVIRCICFLLLFLCLLHPTDINCALESRGIEEKQCLHAQSLHSGSGFKMTQS